MKPGTRIPPVTAAVIAAAVIVFAASRLLVPLENSAEASIFCGAYYRPMILAGDWWRMITVMFVHGSVLHLAVNCWSLWVLGGMLEKRAGSLRFLTVFLGSVIGGSVFILISGRESVAVGMSGGLYGLMAWWLKILFSRRAYLNPAARSGIIRTLAVNLLINLLPGIAWTAHLGGFVSGLILSEIMMPDFDRENRKNWVISGILLAVCCAVLAAGGWNMKTADIYLGSDINVLRAYDCCGLHHYSRRKAEKLDALYGTDGFLQTALESENENG